MTLGTRLGTYWPVESFWHRRDPRTLLITTLALLGITIYLSSLYGQVSILLIIISLYGTANLPFRSIIFNIWPFKWILFLTFIANLMFPGGVNHISLSTNQLIVSIFLILRLLNMILISLWLTMTVRVTTLMNTVAFIFQPLKRVMPVDEIILAMGVAVRFFSILQEESEEIVLAQQARTNRRAVRGLGAVTILIPLLVGSVRRAGEMATAIEARGYVKGSSKTIWPVSKWSTKETLILAATLVGILLLAFIQHES